MLTEPPRSDGARPAHGPPQVLPRETSGRAAGSALLRLPGARGVVVMPDVAAPGGAGHNLVALLSLWLAREGLSVLVHRPGAPTTPGGAAEVLASLGIAPAHDAADVGDRWARREPALVGSDCLAPGSPDVRLGQLLAVPPGALQPLRVVPSDGAGDGAATAAWAIRERAALLRLGGPWPLDARHCPGIDVWIDGRHRPELGAAAFDEPPGRGTPMPRLAAAAAMAVFVQDVLSGQRPMPEPWQRLASSVLRTLQATHAILAGDGESCL